MKNTECWNINENDFPTDKTLKERLLFIIRYGILAPSGHNTQPWKFKINEDSIEIFADTERKLSVIDPDNRELIISCGAAIGNICLALNYFNLGYETVFFPELNNQNFLCRIIIDGKSIQNNFDKKLFKAITKRRTNRLPFDDKQIDGLILQKFETIVSEEKIKLRIFTKEKESLIKLIEEGDKKQSANHEFCEELADWVHSERADREDGIPGYAFGAGDVISSSGPFYIGNLEWGNIQAARDRNLMSGSPVILIIESRSNNMSDWIRTGIALEKMLLYAASENISVSYLNQPLEDNELKNELKEKTGIRGYPQLILRAGYGEKIKPTPRRNLADVIID